MILLLLACLGPEEPELTCPAARQDATAAWEEVRGYFERKATLMQPDLEAAERAVVSAGERRAAAEAGRSTYEGRQRGGLTDLRTGEVKRDPSGVRLNKARAAGAGARVETHADTEEDLIATAMSRRAALEELQAKVALAQQIRDAAAGEDAEAAWTLASRAPELRDTELAGRALEASRKAHEVCAAPE